MRPLHIGVFFALTAAAAAGAQTVLPWDQGIRQLNSGWRTHAGNDPSWATRDFDDSAWTLSALGESHTPTPGPNNEHWYRLKIDLSSRHHVFCAKCVGMDSFDRKELAGRIYSDDASWGIQGSVFLAGIN